MNAKFYIPLIIIFILGLLSCKSSNAIIDSDDFLTKEELDSLQSEINKNIINSQGHIQYDELNQFIKKLPEPQKKYYWNGKLKGYYNTIPQLIYFRYSGNLLSQDEKKFRSWLNEY